MSRGGTGRPGPAGSWSVSLGPSGWRPPAREQRTVDRRGKDRCQAGPPMVPGPSRAGAGPGGRCRQDWRCGSTLARFGSGCRRGGRRTSQLPWRCQCRSRWCRGSHAWEARSKSTKSAKAARGPDRRAKAPKRQWQSPSATRMMALTSVESSRSKRRKGRKEDDAGMWGRQKEAKRSQSPVLRAGSFRGSAVTAGAFGARKLAHKWD